MLAKATRFKPLLGMLIFPVMGMIYAFLNKPPINVHTLITPFDIQTPFISVFILPYSVWIFYIYACLVYFLLKDPKVYWEALVTYTLCALACYAIYTVFQTTVPRPVITGDGILSKIMRWTYNKDQPFNCFPSIHCFSSYMVMKNLYKSSFKNLTNRILIYGMSSLIIASTLFVKQHVILDILSAIVLVEIVYWIVLRTSLINRPLYNRIHAQLQRKTL
ncbi:MAG: phosphatase PAP2 family protein [Gorillibacterium sp.]|nr:phosphatase PAP2 family protein [Gorillibacterium sp.]